MAVREELGHAHIESRLVWKPMDEQPVFAGAESHSRALADAIFHDALSLPSGSAMTDADVDRVVAITRSNSAPHVRAGAAVEVGLGPPAGRR